MKMLTIYLLLLSLFSHAQSELSESEVSEMCMNQILAGLVDDGVLGNKSGLCVTLEKDVFGNISSMDFNLQGTAFESGKDSVTSAEYTNRLNKVKSLILGYQRTIRKDDKLSMDDIDLEIQSYADGEGGPTTYDNEIRQMAKDGTLIDHIKSDSKSMQALKNSNLSGTFDFDSLKLESKSLIRNIVLAKKRSQNICQMLSVSNCDKKKNTGFASPKLEATKKKCAARRVSNIRVNLDKMATKNDLSNSQFHPQFSIPKDIIRNKEGEEIEEHPENKDNLKRDMQLAASFEMLKHHKKISAPAYREELLKTEKNPKIREALKNYNLSNSEFTILDLPPEALNDPNHNNYLGLLKTFSEKYSYFKKNISSLDPELISLAEDGNFIEFKNRLDQTTDVKKRRAINKQLRIFTSSTNGDESTDYYNFYSSGQAIQYNLINKSPSPYLKNAESVMNSSQLTIRMDADSVLVHDPRTQKKRLPWLCQGGCGSGIKEGNDGQFLTDFRARELNTKNSSEMNETFKTPTSFGALKTLNVYTIKNCPDCTCLMDPNISLDQVLSDSSRTTRTPISGFKNQTNGKKSFIKTIDGIESPKNTCLFTPPVAHTCKVKPSGANTPEIKTNTNVNFSCPYWDNKGKEHGLKATTNFLNDVLGIVSRHGNEDECRAKVLPMKEKAETAFCQDSIPSEDACL